MLNHTYPSFFVTHPHTTTRNWFEGIANSRVTVSTVGIVDKMRKLTQDLPEVNLALSLHAPNQDMRTTIVPSAKRYPIEELIDALDKHMMVSISRQRARSTISANENPQNGEYIEGGGANDDFTAEERTKESTRRRAMLEYILIEGPTFSIEAAHQLGKLCEGRQLVVNLIPYNQTDVRDQLRCPSEDHMQVFRNIVSSYGSFCTIRRTMGADIDSACGQLVTIEAKATITRYSSTDIEEVGESIMHVKTHQDTVGMIHKSIRSKASSFKPLPIMDATSIPSINLVPMINALSFATILSAACFVTTTCVFLHRKR
jgi:hypothetical protein